MADKTDLYYINKRIDTIETNIKSEIMTTAVNLKAGIEDTNNRLAKTEAMIRSDIEEIKTLFFAHLDSCEEKMCKMDEKHNTKIEHLLESREVKLCKVDEKLKTIDDKYDNRVSPLEKFKTQVIIITIATVTLLEAYNILH